MDLAFWFKEFGARVVLGKIEDYCYLLDINKNPVLDDRGNKISNGKFQISFLDRMGVQTEAPVAFSAIGNSMFAGGLPEKGAVCVVGFRENNLPVILCFLPHSLDTMFGTRGEIPNLQPGEYLIQSSDMYSGAPLTEDSEVGPLPTPELQFYSGARVLWDKYGRLIIQARGYDCIVGPLLSDEYTGQVAIVKDAITGNEVYFRERFAGGIAEHRVDKLGNFVAFYGKDYHLIVDGTFDVQVKGWRISDSQGDEITVDDKGNAVVKSVSNEAIVSGGSSVRLETGGNLYINAVQSKNETIGFGRSSMVGMNSDDVVGGQRTESTGLAKLVNILGTYFKQITGIATEIYLGSFSIQVAGSKTESVTGALNTSVTGAEVRTSASFSLQSAVINLGVGVMQGALLASAANKYNLHQHTNDGASYPTVLMVASDISVNTKMS